MNVLLSFVMQGRVVATITSVVAALALTSTACSAQTYSLLREFGYTGSGPGEFNSPTFVAVDPSSHNIVVSDTGNSRVQIFDPAGNYLGEFGSAGYGDG